MSTVFELTSTSPARPLVAQSFDGARRNALTAVCLAGEARLLVTRSLRAVIKSNLIEPLLADVFLAVSPQWNLHKRFAVEHKNLQHILSEEKLDEIRHDLRPVMTMSARDADTLRMLRLLNHGREDLQDAFKCASSQSLPTRVEKDDRPTGGTGSAWRASNYQLGTCSPQLSLALRWRACLSMIELAERKRAIPYTWVVRARPDVAIPCALGLHAFSTETILYVSDYLVLMPRVAANISLAQVPLARALNASECFVDILQALPQRHACRDDSTAACEPLWHTMERCNPCLASLAGWPTGYVAAMMWSDVDGEFVATSVAYPARSAFSATGELIPQPFPPFGNATCATCGVPIAQPLHPNCALAAARKGRGPFLRKHLDPRSPTCFGGLSQSVSEMVTVAGLSGQRVDFELGGLAGNVVTTSNNTKIGKGWRLLAVNGELVPSVAADVKAVVEQARRKGKFTATFFGGKIAGGRGLRAVNVESPQ